MFRMPGNCVQLFPELCIARQLTLQLLKALELNSTDRSHLMKFARGTSGRIYKGDTVPDNLKEVINYLIWRRRLIAIAPGVSRSPAFCRALHSVGVTPSHTRNARKW